MLLSEYLAETGESAAAFARRSAVGSRQLINKYLRTQRFPSPENLLRIRVASGGRVTADDFVDQHAKAASLSAPDAPAEAT